MNLRGRRFGIWPPTSIVCHRPYLWQTGWPSTCRHIHRIKQWGRHRWCLSRNLQNRSRGCCYRQARKAGFRFCRIWQKQGSPFAYNGLGQRPHRYRVGQRRSDCARRQSLHRCPSMICFRFFPATQGRGLLAGGCFLHPL